MAHTTIEELIARKQQGQADKLKILEITAKNGVTLQLVKPELEKLLSLLDEVERDASTENNLYFGENVIYLACPMLHNQKLQEVYECKEPFEIALAVLDEDIGELMRIADKVLGFYGLSDVGTTVKN